MKRRVVELTKHYTIEPTILFSQRGDELLPQYLNHRVEIVKSSRIFKKEIKRDLTISARLIATEIKDDDNENVKVLFISLGRAVRMPNDEFNEEMAKNVSFGRAVRKSDKFLTVHSADGKSINPEYFINSTKKIMDDLARDIERNFQSYVKARITPEDFSDVSQMFQIEDDYETHEISQEID